MDVHRGLLANPAWWCNLTVVTWAFASTCLAATQADVDRAAPENPAKNGTLEVHLATLPGFADDAAFLASVTSRVAELQQQAGEAADAARKTGFILAAANLILAEQLEPPSSRKFLQLDKPHQGDDALVAARALDQADALLVEAETFLRTEQKDSTDENPPPTDQAKDLSRIVVTLKAFAQALRAYLVTEADGDPSRAARRAASGLSVIMEDDNPQIAAAAEFWQACLRAMEPDTTPALDILDRAIVDLSTDAPRFGFFSRLLRCRLVAARGGPAAALALLMQVEERANGWFKTEPDRASAMRSCAWIRLRILQDWHDRLDATSQDDERAWCRSRIDTLRTERFSNASGATLLRLNQAIPIIARPSGPNATPPEGTPPPP